MQFIKNACAYISNGVRYVADKAQSVAAAAVGTVAGLLGVSSSGDVLAAAPDLTPLTDAVDFSTVGTSIMAVAGTMAGVYIIWKGAKFVIAALRGL